MVLVLLNLHRVFLSLSRSGAAIRWLSSCNAGVDVGVGVEQARISGAEHLRGKSVQNHYRKCFLHRHHNLKVREVRKISLNPGR